MSTTKKRISICLTKEDLRQLKTLCEEFQENPNQVYKRALILLFHNRFNNKNENKNDESKPNI